MRPPFVIQDITGSVPDTLSRNFGPPPPAELGHNLVTIDDARRWLLHPSNWVDTRLFILKWDGLVPKISRDHAERLLREPWDTGLFWAACHEQRELRSGRRRLEMIENDDVEPE